MRMRTRPPKSRRALPMRASLPGRRSARTLSVRNSAADTRSGQRYRCVRSAADSADDGDPALKLAHGQFLLLRRARTLEVLVDEQRLY